MSRLYRWRGCIPIDVATHSVYMADHAKSDDVALWCLMHDLHEIALSDIPAPAKDLPGMGALNRAEDRFIEAVAVRFGLPLPVPKAVRTLDLRARASEVRTFLPHAASVVRGIRSLPTPLEAWSPRRARAEWLKHARALGIS